MAMDGDLTWVVNRQNIVQMLCGAPGSCMILLTSLSPIHSIKRKTDKTITSERNQEAWASDPDEMQSLTLPWGRLHYALFLQYPSPEEPRVRCSYCSGRPLSQSPAALPGE